jgi:hypothetical protein
MPRAAESLRARHFEKLFDDELGQRAPDRRQARNLADRVVADRLLVRVAVRRDELSVDVPLDLDMSLGWMEANVHISAVIGQDDSNLFDHCSPTFDFSVIPVSM